MMTIAENIGLNICCQCTDSMYIDEDELDILMKYYKIMFKHELVGINIG